MAGETNEAPQLRYMFCNKILLAFLPFPTVETREAQKRNVGPTS